MGRKMRKSGKVQENAENKWDYSGISWEHQRLYRWELCFVDDLLIVPGVPLGREAPDKGEMEAA